MAGADPMMSPEERALRDEVRAEFEQDQKKRDELTRAYDKRVTTLLVSFTVLAAVLVPVVGVILGLSVRLFRLASGL